MVIFGNCRMNVRPVVTNYRLRKWYHIWGGEKIPTNVDSKCGFGFDGRTSRDIPNSRPKSLSIISLKQWRHGRPPPIVHASHDFPFSIIGRMNEQDGHVLGAKPQQGPTSDRRARVPLCGLCFVMIELPFCVSSEGREGRANYFGPVRRRALRAFCQCIMTFSHGDACPFCLPIAPCQ